MIHFTNRRVFVTGATGFIGHALLNRLYADSGYELLGAVRKEPALLLPEIPVLNVGELGPSTDWGHALERVDVVVHTAARVHDMDDQSIDLLAEFRRANVEGTLNLARQAAAAEVKRFVFISSIKVNGEQSPVGKLFTADDIPAPEDAYGISKMEAEQGLLHIAGETGMEVVIIRPPLVYGPGVKGNFAAMMKWLAKGVPLPLGAVRNNRRSLVALNNLVDLIVTCINHPAAANQVFLAGDGEDLSTTELLERLAQAMDKPTWLIIPLPVWMLRAGAALLGKADVAQRLFGSLQVDISKARKKLGWSPPVSVDEGLRRAVEPLASEPRPFVSDNE